MKMQPIHNLHTEVSVNISYQKSNIDRLILTDCLNVQTFLKVNIYVFVCVAGLG